MSPLGANTRDCIWGFLTVPQQPNWHLFLFFHVTGQKACGLLVFLSKLYHGTEPTNVGACTWDTEGDHYAPMLCVP